MNRWCVITGPRSELVYVEQLLYFPMSDMDSVRMLGEFLAPNLDYSHKQYGLNAELNITSSNVDHPLDMKIDNIEDFFLPGSDFDDRNLQSDPTVDDDHIRRIATNMLRCPVVNYETAIQDLENLEVPTAKRMDTKRTYDEDYRSMMLNYQEIIDIVTKERS
jgi:hypothetical protein